MNALPDVSGVPHPATWPFYPHRWLGRFVVRRRYSVVEHGTENVPADGAVVFAANHIGVADGPLLGLFGPRPVHVLTKQEMFRGGTGTFLRRNGQIPLDRFHSDVGAMKTCLRVLADGHAVGIFPEGTRGAGELTRFRRGAAYLALVSGAPVVPVTFFGTREPGAGSHALPPKGGRVDIVYGAPYRTPDHPAGQPWPRTKKRVEVIALDLRVHMLVALDAARTLTGRSLPGPVPSGPLPPDRPGDRPTHPPTSVTPGANHGGTP